LFCESGKSLLLDWLHATRQINKLKMLKYFILQIELIANILHSKNFKAYFNLITF